MLPDDAVVKETRELSNGDELEVFELPKEGQDFIQAYLVAQRWIMRLD